MKFAPESVARRRLAWAFFAVGGLLLWWMLADRADDPSSLLYASGVVGLFPITFRDPERRPVATAACGWCGVALGAVMFWRLVAT
jgi:hypothetical protein